MTKQCSRCFEFKALTEFTTVYRRCKTCRAAMEREARAFKRTGKRPVPTYLTACYNFVRMFLKRYDGTASVSIPARDRGAPRPAPNAVVIRHVNGKDWIYLASHYGTKSFLFDTIGPETLINEMATLNLEPALPGSD